MSDLSPNATPAVPAQPPRRRGRAVFFVALIALAAGLAGAFASTAFSQGYGFGPRGWHGRGFIGELDPAQIEARADRMVRHLAVEVDATPEQQERLRAVVRAAVKDLLPMRDKARTARLRARELLVAPNLDSAAIESLRAEHMALADAFSKRVAQALADTAAILTVDQRRKIAELLPPRPAFWHRWHRG